MTNIMDRSFQDRPGGEDTPHAEDRLEPISTSSEWTFDLIQQYDDEIAKCAAEFGLDTYPNQVEVISAEQMMFVMFDSLPLN
jgi:stage V sporulation protein R